MNFKEAQRQNYNYLGPKSVWRQVDDNTKKIIKLKQQAEEITKIFRDAKYVIVAGTELDYLGQGNFAIMGNNNFNKVFTEYTFKAYTDARRNYMNKIKTLTKRYNEEIEYLKYLQNNVEKLLQEYDELKIK